MTTAPTWGAWNTRNGVSAKYAVRSTSSRPKRRSGLSDPKRVIASAYVIVGISPISCPGRPATASGRPPPHLDHVGLLDEAHLDVELGELRLPVLAEVLVAVAPAIWK
jgi:hypothetical protein